jgi:putative FmdB family regulatory protein
MPIYEYLCPSCNRIYSFLAQGFDIDRQPTCPRCGATDLEKQISRFSFVRGGERPASAAPDAAPAGGPDATDDPRVEREMMRLMGEMEHMDEDDPRQLGRLMRRMSEITGEPLDEEMEEAVRRLEAGEDPERIEEELGGALGGEDDFGGPGGMRGPPSYDEGLYPL